MAITGNPLEAKKDFSRIRIDVLDHGFVRIIDHMGGDLAIAQSARVSYNAAWRAGENEQSDTKLIRFLYKNRHTTPFEDVEFKFEVMAPIFVFRQWHRHRMATINELSARYKELPETYYVPNIEDIGVQSLNNKQARDVMILPEHMRAIREVELEEVRQHHMAAFKLYRKLLASGWPRELARTVLPLATYSHMFWKTDLHNLFGFLRLRADKHAQKEIRVYAAAMLELIQPIVPVAVKAFKDYPIKADLSYDDREEG